LEFFHVEEAYHGDDDDGDHGSDRNRDDVRGVRDDDVRDPFWNLYIILSFARQDASYSQRIWSYNGDPCDVFPFLWKKGKISVLACIFMIMQ